MAELAKTALGRTGLEVTKLGYGAMELRGPAGGRGREIDPADAARILNAVLDAGINFIDTSPDYGNSEALIGAAISRPARRVLPREQVRVPDRPAPAARWRTPGARVHPREHPRRRRAEPAAHEDRPHRPRAVPREPVTRAARGERCGRSPRGAARRGQDPLPRDVGHAAQHQRPHRDGRLRRVPDPLLRARARARSRDHRSGRRGIRHHHPRRCRAWAARQDARGRAICPGRGPT